MQTITHHLMTTLVILLVVSCNSHADFKHRIESTWDNLTRGPLYFQSQLGFSSETDFAEAVIFFDYEKSEERNFLTSLSFGRKISDTMLVWPFEVVAYASLQRFNERGIQKDIWGTAVFAKAYSNFNIGSVPFRLGFGHGLSYVTRLPAAEVREFLPDRSEKLIYHMDYSLQVSLLHLMSPGQKRKPKGVEDIFIGYGIWHRSTLFGLLGEISGGTNYMGLSIETVLK